MKIRVSGIEGLAGEYEVAEPPYTTKEWREIKQKTGLLPLDLEVNFGRGDPDVSAALMWVTMTRAGKDSRFVWAMLDDADMFSTDTFQELDDTVEEAEEEIPPASTPPSTDDGKQTEPDEESGPSGPSGTPPLALLENPPSPTGFPRSATGAA